MTHKFHIPVLGLGFSIDTPLKVAKYGISSVVSIVDDDLIERMRSYHCIQQNLPYKAIAPNDFDSRANRITSYLNLMQHIVERDFRALTEMPFEPGNELCRYFELLPEDSSLRHGYELMMDYPEGQRKMIFQQILRKRMTLGRIDVNIMSKVDAAAKHHSNGILEEESSDALAALRGFAKSDLSSSLILSAGMNPKLYAYLEEFSDFFPDENGKTKKQVVLKVSDFRSAFIQAKFLAKKGIWVSEFRVESGLNCGGHAFATNGYLLGPILEEFKQMRAQMKDELFALYHTALNNRGLQEHIVPQQRISVQGGIGTANENEFLLKHYQLDSTGWGSPFLLVPEVTNVDDDTLENLANATEESYYLSNSSPLGILFNNFKGTSMEQLRLSRIKKNKPGSPCTKKYLCSNTEFTSEPICTASNKYQKLKINALMAQDMPAADLEKKITHVTEKICLCEGLCSSTYQKLGLAKPKEAKAVAVCPGPNLAYFSGIYSLDEMVGHIYGRNNLIDNVVRPNFFIKELNLYVNYLHTEIKEMLADFNSKKESQLIKFKAQLMDGVAYYKKLMLSINDDSSMLNTLFKQPLLAAEAKLLEINI